MYYNDKINAYFRLKSQKEHYRRIVQVKKVINFSKIQHTALTCVKNNHKYQNQKDRLRKQNNFRLLSRITTINNKDGLLQSMEKQSYRRKKIKFRNSAQTIHSSSQFQYKLQRENQKMVQRLNEVKPAVGTRERWEDDFQRSRSFEKRMHKYSKNQSIDPNIFMRQNITRLTQRKKKSNKTDNQRKIYTSLAKCWPTEIENEQQTLNLRRQSEVQSTQGRNQKRKTRRLLKPKKQANEQTIKLSINKIILNKDNDTEQ